MTNDECIVGAKVICRHSLNHGEIGTINDITKDEFGYVCYYSVVDDNGAPIGFHDWYSVNYWDIYTGLSEVPMTGFKLCQKPKSKECPCGINRKDCEYHK